MGSFFIDLYRSALHHIHIFPGYCIDAKWYGNVARFINHSCDPNLVKQVGMC